MWISMTRAFKLLFNHGKVKDTYDSWEIMSIIWKYISLSRYLIRIPDPIIRSKCWIKRSTWINSPAVSRDASSAGCTNCSYH